MLFKAGVFGMFEFSMVWIIKFLEALKREWD